MVKGCLRLVINELSLYSKLSYISLNILLVVLFNKLPSGHVMAENLEIYRFLNACFSDLGSP